MRSLVITIVLLFIAATAVAGCNTVEGMGRDIESAGESIQNM
jgi:predicted small secreted protein